MVAGAGLTKDSHKQYGSIPTDVTNPDEAVSLLGEREDNSTKAPINTGLSRIGLIPSLIAFFVLVSAAFVLRSNSGTEEVTPLPADVYSSLFSRKRGKVHYTNGGFSGGKGYPIYVLAGVESSDHFLFESIIEKAKGSKAYIINGKPGKSLLTAIKEVRDELGCASEDTNPDHCLVVIFESIGKSKLSVKILDEHNNLISIAEVNPRASNGLLSAMDALHDAAYAYEVRARDDYSDGALMQPTLLTPTTGSSCDRGAPVGDSDVVYELTLDVGDHATVIASTFRTRLFNGQLPGPMIKISPGETFRVHFRNNLALQAGTVLECNNEFCRPDHTNLHYHGGHVSGDCPSDDVEMTIEPGSCYNYFTEFPDNHMPGTHWFHPHFHGSSTVQVGGGAALPMIVEDGDFSIPDEVAQAEDVMLFVQPFEIDEIDDITNSSFHDGYSDQHWEFTPIEHPRLFNSFLLVNGQYRPVLTVTPGAWYRLRVAYAGWFDSQANLNLKFDGHCETNLLAKDGIYLRDYPRPLSLFPVPTAGRADIMLRCNEPGTINVTASSGDEVLMTLQVEGTPVVSAPPTTDFPWDFPDYLDDVLDQPVMESCSCATSLSCSGNCTVNGQQFEKHEAVHTIKFGEMVERTLSGISFHPYHQHVYPFQLSEGYGPNDINFLNDPTHGGYFKNGDWHDVIRSPNQNNAKIKFRANVHAGKMMLHCHRLKHEDTGMMSQEQIIDDGECACDVNLDFDAGECDSLLS